MVEGRDRHILWSYVDASGAPAFDGRFLLANPFESAAEAKGDEAPHVARVAGPDGKMGVIALDGRVLVPLRFEHVLGFLEGVAQVNEGGWYDDRGNVTGGKWGFVRADGQVLLEPTYEFALGYECGRVTVRQDKKYGFLDREGKAVVECRYPYMSFHREGLAVFSDGSADGFLDVDGNVAIAPTFQEATTFESGLARIKQNGKWGVIDKDGKVVHEPTYDRLGVPIQGALWAVLGGECWLLRADGERVGPFAEIRQASKEEHGPPAWPVRRGDRWLLVHVDGTEIVGDAEDAMRYFGGTARIKRDGKWGYVDATGATTIEPRFDDCFGLEGGYVAARIGDDWGMVDASGAEVLPFEYMHVGNARHGRVKVLQDGLAGFVDPATKETVIPIELDGAGDCAFDRIAVMRMQRAAPFDPGPKVHTMPPGGLAHPYFEDVGEEHLITVVGWGHELTVAEELMATRMLDAWQTSARARKTGKIYTEKRWLSRFSMYLRVENLVDARAEVSTLLHEMRAAGLPIVEALFARWGWPANDTVMAARPLKEQPPVEVSFPNFEAYWRVVWGLIEIDEIPAPENSYYLRGALTDRNGKLSTLEERLIPMWMPDVKICMGALQKQGETYLDRDERTAEVEEILEHTIARRFRQVWCKPDLERWIPRMFKRDNGTGLEKLTYEGRTGYCFAIECGDLLHLHSGARMRYREPELMEALRDGIVAADLEPVILWQRFQKQIPMMPMGTPTIVVVQVWEKA